MCGETSLQSLEPKDALTTVHGDIFRRTVISDLTMLSSASTAALCSSTRSLVAAASAEEACWAQAGLVTASCMSSGPLSLPYKMHHVSLMTMFGHLLALQQTLFWAQAGLLVASCMSSGRLKNLNHIMFYFHQLLAAL